MPKFTFKVAQMLEYEHVFVGKPLQLTEFIRHIGKEKVLMMSAFFVNRDVMHMQESIVEFVYDFFTKENQEFADRLLTIILKRFGEQLKVNSMAAINFINPTALYHIIETALSLPDSPNPNYEVSPSDQIEYLRMLLAENTKITQRQNPKMNKPVKTVKDAIPLMLACQIADWDYSHARLAEVCMAQIFKCVYFFQYAEKSLPMHLQQFCSQNHVSSWKKYAQGIISLLLPLDAVEGGNIVVPTSVPDYEQVVSIFNKLSSGIFKGEDDYDFIKLRNCPMYRRSDGGYMVLSKLFLAEKLYKSLYFEFNAINESLGTSSIDDFKSYIGLHFAEEYLCNKILNKSFPNRFVKITGEMFREKGFKDSEPDYYSRNKNKAFLFECKDALFLSSPKVSFDIDQVSEEICKKLYHFTNKKGKDSPKAIRQLLNNARRLIEENVIEDIQKKDILRIYPIIVTHDRAFTSPGVNWLIHQWYSKELQNSYTQLRGHVCSVIVFDIDTLILTCTRLQSRRIILEHLIEQYVQYMLSNDNELNQLPFSEYAHGVLFAKGNDMQDMIEDLKVLVSE